MKFIITYDEMQTLNVFDQWNSQKKIIDKKFCRIFFKERDVFFIQMWKNIRFEQNGQWEDFARPVVIIKKFNNDVFWGIALSSRQKKWKYYFNFSIKDIQQYAILSQLRLYDKNRILKKIGMISSKDFLLLKQKIKSLF